MGVHFHVGSYWLFSFYSQTGSPHTRGEGRAGAGPGGRQVLSRQEVSIILAPLSSARRSSEHHVESLSWSFFTRSPKARGCLSERKAALARGLRETWGGGVWGACKHSFLF